MRKDNKPTENQLTELYQAAIEFKQAKPWEHFYDTDLICVENPENKMIGYCSIMGKAGEYYALSVNLGDRGLWGFTEIIDRSYSLPPHQLLHLKDCIMCSFEDRNELTNKDRNQIKSLGFSFRGRNAWPMFRRFEPGFAPWFINEEECIFLTHALRQTLIAVEDVLDGKLKMDMDYGKTVLRYSSKENGKLNWHSKEVQLMVPRYTFEPIEVDDELLVHRIKKASFIRNVTLQAEVCYMVSPVQDKKDKRPYFPRLFILADEGSGLVLDYEMYRDIDNDADVVFNKIKDFCVTKGAPREIQVRSDEMVAILQDLCARTNIRLRTVDELTVIDYMLDEMIDRFGY